MATWMRLRRGGRLARVRSPVSLPPEEDAAWGRRTSWTKFQTVRPPQSCATDTPPCRSRRLVDNIDFRYDTVCQLVVPALVRGRPRIKEKAPTLSNDCTVAAPFIWFQILTTTAGVIVSYLHLASGGWNKLTPTAFESDDSDWFPNLRVDGVQCRTKEWRIWRNDDTNQRIWIP